MVDYPIILERAPFGGEMSFKGMASVSVASGNSCLLWDDLWAGNVSKLEFPELHSFAKKPNISLVQARTQMDLASLFNLPLSVQAFDQWALLECVIQNLPETEDCDVWSYIWGSNSYSSSKAYKHLMGTCNVHPVFKWIWKSCCKHKHKVFFWLLVQDRLSTRNILRRKNMHLQSFNCVLCNESCEETVEHLFLKCRISRSC
jgi:hypothetical protein